jgi:hypothetical protein
LLDIVKAIADQIAQIQQAESPADPQAIERLKQLSAGIVAKLQASRAARPPVKPSANGIAADPPLVLAEQIKVGLDAFMDARRRHLDELRGRERGGA